MIIAAEEKGEKTMREILFRNRLDSDYYSHKVLFSKDVEVISNIYDNPELLSGEVKSDE